MSESANHTESVRDAPSAGRLIPWFESTRQDLRLALRSLCKSPGFTATAILTLALGVGANAAIFQLLDAVLLQSLPVADPSTLAAIQIKGGNRGLGISSGEENTLTFPLWQRIRENQEPFASVMAWSSAGMAIGEGVQERRVEALWVSGEFFGALGVWPARGRVFTDDDDQPGCGAPGVVISYGFWQSQYAGQDSAVGSKLIVEGRPVEIIGVTPPAFFGLEVGRKFDLAVPFCSRATLYEGDAAMTRRDYFWVDVLGRLKPGWTAARATAQLESLSPGLMEATVPDRYSAQTLETYRRFRLAAAPAGNGIGSLRKQFDAPLWLLLGTTGLVLLIACANLANLMLARGSTREREMAVRLALGASRAQLIRQLFAEGAVLAVIGAILGGTLAGLFSRSLVHLLHTEANLLRLDLAVGWRTLAFIAAIAVATCVVFSLAPAFQTSRAEPIEALKSGGRGNTASRSRYAFQRTLVVAQIAVSLVLLVGALLFVRSFRNIMAVDPGFRHKDIVVVFVDWEKLRLPKERNMPFTRELLEQTRAIPQIDSAAVVTRTPFGGSWTMGITVDATQGSSKVTWATPGYFQTLEIPFLSGRDFNDRDLADSPRVAVVSETFVRKFLDGKQPIGAVLRTAPEPYYPAASYEIVGVVKDTKYAGLREEVTPPEVFAPESQFPNQSSWMNLLIRTSNPSGAIRALREKFAQINPALSVDQRLLDEQIDDSLVRERLMALLSGFFGALAALLAMIGLYGVISYVIATRRGEIGVRMALGASRAQIVGDLILQTARMLAFGVAAGVLLSLAVTRGASSLLFGLRASDPVSIAGAAAALIAVALVASYIPARRASRIEPTIALRYE